MFAPGAHCYNGTLPPSLPLLCAQSSKYLISLFAPGIATIQPGQAFGGVSKRAKGAGIACFVSPFRSRSTVFSFAEASWLVNVKPPSEPNITAMGSLRRTGGLGLQC